MIIDYGTLIKMRRKDMHISQEKLAELTGYSTSTVGDFERGIRDIRLYVFLDLLAALDLKIEIVEMEGEDNG